MASWNAIKAGPPLILLCVVAGYGVAVPAKACNETQRLCVVYQTDFDDDVLEGPTLGPTVPARGARVVISRPPPEAPLGLYLDQDGCVDFPTQFGAGHKFSIYPTAILGTSRNIRISVFDWHVLPQELNDFEDFNDDEFTDDLQLTESDHCDGPGANDDDEFLCTVATPDVANLMAIATHAIHTLDSMDGSLLDDEHELNIVRMHEVPTFAFRSGNNLAIGTGAPQRKFVIAHEIGHWIQGQAQMAEGTDDSWEKSYVYPSGSHESPEVDPEVDGPLSENGYPAPECEFAVNYEASTLLGFADTIESRLESHGLRSAEYSSAAMTEGFAHFVAAVVANGAENPFGWFVYYKDIDTQEVPAYQDLMDFQGNVELPGEFGGGVFGGTTQWLKTNCETDWDLLYFDAAEEIPTAVSSEIDWLRFYWEFLTSDAPELGSQPGFWDVARIVAYTYTHDPWGGIFPPAFHDPHVFERMVGTLNESSSGLTDYRDRFVDLNDLHGVYHELP